ncbi:hypothetical protein GCM10027416_14870 [Okibacterium endophyticum]
MQLGTRWSVGDDTPGSLPDVVVDAVRTVEDELKADDVDTAGWRWTLTWLEGLPVVDLDDGTHITYHPESHSATVRSGAGSESDEDPF